jgi:hypothetical protein
LASFNARPPDLQPRRLMDMDFVVSCPLVPPWLPPIRFLYIGPHLRYGFLQTSPRDDALASRLYFTSIRLDGGLAPPSCQTCSAHTKKALKATHLQGLRTLHVQLFVNLKADRGHRRSPRPWPARSSVPATCGRTPSTDLGHRVRMRHTRARIRASSFADMFAATSS